MARFIKNRKQTIGTAPGSVVFIGNKKTEKPYGTVLTYNASHFEYKENIDVLAIDTSNTSMVSWINFYGLHDEDIIKQIGQTFNFSNLLLEDIVNTDHRPGVFFYDSQIAVIFKFITYNSDFSIHTDQITCVLGENYVFTFQEKSAQIFDPIRKRIENKQGRITSQKADYLLYSILDSLIDSTFIAIEQLGIKIESLENSLHHSYPKIASEIFKNKNEILYARKHIRPYKELLFSLVNTKNDSIQASTIPYLRDLQEMTNQALETIDLYYDMANNQLNIHNTHLSNKSNEIVKVLTIFSTIFIPLTFIAGIYGTNFTNVYEYKFEYGFYYMIGLMLFIVVGLLLYFKRKRWF